MTPEITRMRYHALILAAFAFACGRNDQAAELPPATGPGAPPLPELPAVAGDAGARAVAPTAGHTTGTLYAHAEAALGPNASGVITKITVDEGARVKKGQVLVQLDARDARLRLDQARAALEAARVQLRAVQIEYDRTRSLYDQGAATKAVMDRAQAQLDAAQVGVTQAQAAVAMAEKGVADTVVRAPMDGVVVAKLKSEGEMVTMMPPTVVLVVQDQSTLDLKFRLPEEQLAHVHAGDPVTATLTSLGVTRSATVARVNPIVDPRTRTIEVVAELDNRDGALKPGLLAEVALGAAP